MERYFKDIHDDISTLEVRKLYGTLYEAAEEKFVDTATIIRRKKLAFQAAAAKETVRALPKR